MEGLFKNIFTQSKCWNLIKYFSRKQNRIFYVLLFISILLCINYLVCRDFRLNWKFNYELKDAANCYPEPYIILKLSRFLKNIFIYFCVFINIYWIHLRNGEVKKESLLPISLLDNIISNFSIFIFFHLLFIFLVLLLVKIELSTFFPTFDWQNLTMNEFELFQFLIFDCLIFALVNSFSVLIILFIIPNYKISMQILLLIVFVFSKSIFPAENLIKDLNKQCINKFEK